ncbi:Protein CBR-ACBP-7 [Caenorhabditis briggsae]|nr:Protein CBR-ACBP-7 [Caenorhabditis briggsae]UMM23516.1 hypothetical protein L5515_004195 [Caenorhabditis briggsae]CAP35500.1 Protein CBR-ACBP-7 [Caenorhabditis briggsae]
MQSMWRTLILSTILLVSITSACNKNGEGCLLMRNVLRDPLRLSTWKVSSLNRAINQLQAYQQLFHEDKRSSSNDYSSQFSEMMRRRRRMESALDDFKRIRARFVQRKVLKFQFELFTKFENHTRNIWGFYQQALVGDVNVPKLNYMEIDEGEKSWMWKWINGNEKWHAWNKCRGLSKEEASTQFVEAVQKLKLEIYQLLSQWKLEISNDPKEVESNTGDTPYTE